MQAAGPRWVHAVLVAWLSAAVATTVVAGTSYVMIQHVSRSGADDVPRALAQRSAAALARGKAPDVVASGPAVELATDLSPFVIVFGADATVAASSATMDGRTPVVPPGVLAQARLNGMDRVTWQPRAGVREAVVAMPWQSSADQGVVVVGASLQSIERRDEELRWLVLAGWLAALAGSLLVAGLGALWLRPQFAAR